MIAYRTLDDLSRLLHANVHRIPRDVDLIVGVPRSGLLVANILALQLNLPLTDLAGLLEGRLIGGGDRLASSGRPTGLEQMRRVLIVDDSVGSGNAIRAARRQVQSANLPCAVSYCAAYIDKDAMPLVDMWFEVLPNPRIFEWNVMHHGNLKLSCVDIDGVLCVDPTREQNDDGPLYETFLSSAPLRCRPTASIGWLVTSRLEKYRRQTEAWLREHDIQYAELVMLDLPTKEARIRAAAHGSFKAEVYRRSQARLFIESSQRQAVDIARLAQKPVLSIETNTLIVPSVSAQLSHMAARVPSGVWRRAKRLWGRLQINEPHVQGK